MKPQLFDRISMAMGQVAQKVLDSPELSAGALASRARSLVAAGMIATAAVAAAPGDANAQQQQGINPAAANTLVELTRWAVGEKLKNQGASNSDVRYSSGAAADVAKVAIGNERNSAARYGAYSAAGGALGLATAKNSDERLRNGAIGVLLGLGAGFAHDKYDEHKYREAQRQAQTQQGATAHLVPTSDVPASVRNFLKSTKRDLAAPGSAPLPQSADDFKRLNPMQARHARNASLATENLLTSLNQFGSSYDQYQEVSMKMGATQKQIGEAAQRLIQAKAQADQSVQQFVVHTDAVNRSGVNAGPLQRVGFEAINQQFDALVDVLKADRTVGPRI